MRLTKLTVIAVLAAACGGAGDVTVTAAVTPTAGGSDCFDLTDEETAQLVESWYGDGTFTVEAAAKAITGGSGMFSEIWYLQGSAPAVDSGVFAFATAPGGLLVGADQVTRDFFEWGADVQAGSQVAQEAGSALAAAPDCLP